MKRSLFSLLVAGLVVSQMNARPHPGPLPRGEGESCAADWRDDDDGFADAEETETDDDMKLNNVWKTLTRDQRRAWNAWAKSNPVLMDDGSLRRVSGHKAMTMVLRNRAIAGDAANATTVPATFAWLSGALSLRDAGPFTTNAGYVGFRVEQNLGSGTKWFVWATPPLDGDASDAQKRLRFVKCMALGAQSINDLLPTIGADYAAVNGSWDGPGEDGEWPADKFIWFRVHQYANGQLGPAIGLKGRIQVEL